MRRAQLVLELDGGEVAEVEAVVAAVAGDQVDHEQDVGRGFLGVDALELHLRRQLRQRECDAILHEHLRQVHVGADLESHRQCVVAVVGGLRRHVEHVLDAVDLLLDRGGDGIGHDRGVGARVARGHLHRGRRDVGVQLDGQEAVGHRAAKEDDEGHDPGEDRAVYEKAG